jgi:hypothetical protein
MAGPSNFIQAFEMVSNTIHRKTPLKLYGPPEYVGGLQAYSDLTDGFYHYYIK